jgi:hypothetical protein
MASSHTLAKHYLHRTKGLSKAQLETGREAIATWVVVKMKLFPLNTFGNPLEVFSKMFDQLPEESKQHFLVESSKYYVCIHCKHTQHLGTSKLPSLDLYGQYAMHDTTSKVPPKPCNFEATVKSLRDPLSPVFSSQTTNNRKCMKCNIPGVLYASTLDALPQSLLFVNICEGLVTSKGSLPSLSYQVTARFHFPETFQDENGNTWELTGRIHSTSAKGGHFNCFTKSSTPTPGIYFFDDKENHGRAKLYSPENAKLIGNFPNSAFVVYIKTHRADKGKLDKGKGKLKITLNM